MAWPHTPSLPHRLLWWYTCSVTAAGGLVIAYALSQLPSTPKPLVWFPLSILTLVATRFALKLPGVAAHTSISDTFFFVSALLCGPWPATVTIALDGVVLSWNRKHRWQQLLFNPSSSALSLWGSACVYTALANAVGSARSDAGSGTLIPLTGMLSKR